MLLTLRTLAQRYPGGQLPLLDPVADMGIQDEQVSDSQSNLMFISVFNGWADPLADMGIQDGQVSVF